MKGMKWLGREVRREKERTEGNTEEMTTTQSAMLLGIVRVDFPTQQGHRGWGPLLSAPLSKHLHSLSHYFPHPTSQGPFRDIILYKNTQLLSDGNASWLGLSGCLGSTREARRKPALWLVDRVVTWGDIHGDPWWGCAWRANSQRALPFTFDPWW